MKLVRLERLTGSQASTPRLTFPAFSCITLFTPSHSIPSFAFSSSLSVSKQDTDLACQAWQHPPPLLYLGMIAP